MLLYWGFPWQSLGCLSKWTWLPSHPFISQHWSIFYIYPAEVRCRLGTGDPQRREESLSWTGIKTLPSCVNMFNLAASTTVRSYIYSCCTPPTHTHKCVHTYTKHWCSPFSPASINLCSPGTSTWTEEAQWSPCSLVKEYGSQETLILVQSLPLIPCDFWQVTDSSPVSSV